jgi:hypothetical protein
MYTIDDDVINSDFVGAETPAQRNEFWRCCAPRLNPAVRYMYDQGLDNYLMGQWKTAQVCFRACLRESPTDGPTKSLLHYLARLDNQCPTNWKRYRTLPEITGESVESTLHHMDIA